jgi:hypothetical protein
MIRTKAVTEIPLRLCSFPLRLGSRTNHDTSRSVAGDAQGDGEGGVAQGDGGESFLRVHWVAVPEAVRARRVNRRRRQLRSAARRAAQVAGPHISWHPPDGEFSTVLLISSAVLIMKCAAGGRPRLVVEPLWSQFTSECQHLGHPPRLNNWNGMRAARRSSSRWHSRTATRALSRHRARTTSVTDFMMPE